MKFIVTLILTFSAQVITRQLAIGNDVVCHLENASDLGPRLVQRERFIYICEVPLDSKANLCVTQSNHCQQLSCNMQGTQVLVDRASNVGEKDEEDTLPRAHILIATILGLGFVVSAIGLFIWVRTTRRANVCWAKTHAHTSPAHSELSISDDNHLDEKNDFNGTYGGTEKTERPDDQQVTRDVELREHKHSSSIISRHIPRDLKKESIAEVEEER